MCIVGESGTGKSALLCNWEKKFCKENNDRHVFMYHFGCARGTTSAIAFLSTASAYLGELIENEDEKENYFKMNNAKILCRSFQKLLLDYESKFGKKIIIIIDGLDKMKLGKNSKPFYWLQDGMLNAACFILSTNRTDQERMNVMKERNFDIMDISLLTNEKKLAICSVKLIYSIFNKI